MKTLELPLSHTGLVHLRASRARHTGLVLVSGTKVQIPQGCEAKVIKTFHERTMFVLPTSTIPPGEDFPIVVCYRLLLPGTIANGAVHQSHWELRQKDFLPIFEQKVRAYRDGPRHSASIFNLEENGELTKLAYLSAQSAMWKGIQFFGAGMSNEPKRDPFDLE